MGRQVDLDDLAGAGEVADLLGLAHVSSVHNIRRRYPDFPKPVKTIGQIRIWLIPEVEDWAKRTGRISTRQ